MTTPSAADLILHRRRLLYVQALALSTFALLILSWPLWLDAGSYPRVPFLRGWPGRAGVPRDGLPWLLACSLVIAALTARWRASLVPAALVLLHASLGDQNRLQPWVYQYLVVGLALCFTSVSWGLRLAAWFHAALYFHSGLSKLDWTFAHELGPAFLSVPAAWFGTTPAAWPEPERTALSLAMPALEIVLASFLVFRRTRTLGLVLAVLLHLGILSVLGPWGLDHGLTVLTWNVALLVQELILFWPQRDHSTPPRLADLPLTVRVLFGLVVVMPFFERLGLWDTWPSFAVYASHNERAELYLSDDDKDLWPISVRPFVLEITGPDRWRRVDLLGWSRSVHGTPPYPQARTSLGVAKALLAGEKPPRSLRVVVQGRADRWTGQRVAVTIRSREELDRRLRRYLLNAWPASPTGSFFDDRAPIRQRGITDP